METTMSGELYKLILERKIKDGAQLDHVKTRLAALFKTDIARIDALFVNAPVVIKRGLKQAEALKYKQAIEQTGARCRIEPASAAPPITASQAKQPARLPKPPKTILYQSVITFQEVGFYKYIVWPFVKVKNAVESIFKTIFGMIWSELMGQKYTPSQTAQLIAFFIFSGAAFMMSHVPDYVGDVALWSGVAIWFFDRFLAQHAYFHTAKQERLLLKRKNAEQLTWERINPDGDVDKVDFTAHDMIQISLVQNEVLGGAFQEVVGVVWKIFLSGDDGGELLLDQQEEVIQAVNRAKKLAGVLNVPVKFLDSEGDSELAVDNLKAITTIGSFKQNFRAAGTVGRHEDTTGFHVFSIWNRSNIMLLFRNVLYRSGFLLFLLIIDGVMWRYGNLLNWLIGPWFGIEDTELSLDLSFTGVLSILAPSGGWRAMLKLAIAIGIMVYQGWKMSQRKSLVIDSQKTTYSIGRRLIAELSTADIELPLLVTSPAPLLLVMDQKTAIEIDNLQTINEFRAFAAGMIEGIKKFRVFDENIV
jgi:hypothetical protein